MPTQTPGLFLVCRKLFLVLILGFGSGSVDGARLSMNPGFFA